MTDFILRSPHAFGAAARNQWGEDGGDAANWKGWLNNHAAAFDARVQDLNAKLQQAFVAIQGEGASDPTALAAYQTALQEYNMYRMMQSNSAKNLADMQKQNIRNLG